MKRLHFILVFLLLSSAVSAYDAKIDGIYYYFNNEEKTATVTYQQEGWYTYSSDYSGNITIPNEVVWKKVTYKVVNIGAHAFDNSKRLISVAIPNNITSIGMYAFQSCDKLSISFETSTSIIKSFSSLI